MASPQFHPIRGDELRMLRELQRNTTGAFVFETERGGPFTADAVNRLVKTIGERAKLPFGVHAHMLRHACGYARPTQVMTHGSSKTGSATVRSNIPRATRS
jgi:type 1 fimbriae regulatory protein FimB/type 1 fimbriae regulatory protein FimE